MGEFAVATESQLDFIRGVQPTAQEIDEILLPLAPVLAREADAILDLRELLISQGHPGKCVRCFFRLFEAAGEDWRSSLALLQSWLEKNVEISIRRNGEELEALPFALKNDEDLEKFCLRSIDHVRMDRHFGEGPLMLAFRYKSRAA